MMIHKALSTTLNMDNFSLPFMMKKPDALDYCYLYGYFPKKNN